jgi:hypothetical protein
VIFAGLVLLLAGFVLNAQVLKRSRDAGLTAGQTLRSLPWRVAMALVAAGLLLVVIAHP